MPASDQRLDPTRYQLIPRVLVFLRRGEQLLLLKVAAKPGGSGWAGRYNGVGGHVERGEDVLSAAQREVLEETGLIAQSLWLCGVVTVDTGSPVGIGLYVLRGEAPQGELTPSKEGSLEWVDAQSVYKLPLVEDLPVLLPAVLAMHPGDPPFSACSSYNEAGKLQIRFFSR